jgi:hypothetical protein
MRKMAVSETKTFGYLRIELLVVENSSRPAFRSTLSQPSQMGNFKHQSLRASERERDRDRDTDKDRERDIRDKEGQERLRHVSCLQFLGIPDWKSPQLSDKYDRDRLALPSTLSNLRNKERDTAPHLSVGSSTRTSAQPQATNASSRRAEARDSTKKKAGESSEDWRRGATIFIHSIIKFHNILT